jgi:Protein required for attachment to host cells
MNKIIILADLGHFCAYRLSHTPLGTGKLDLIECFDSVEAHARYSEKVSDRPGKFGQARGKDWSKGYGEPHNTILENEKRLINNIATSINKIIGEEKCDSWCLAAQKTINGQIVNSLEPSILAKLAKNITADLTKADKFDLPARFG